MRRIKQYIAKSVAGAICVVLLVIVALDGISQFVDELDNLEGQYTLMQALSYAALSLPSTIYEFLPLACLVGCLIGLGTLASSNELTIIRAAGVSTAQIIWLVMRPILLFVALGYGLGEFVTPLTDQYAESRKSIALGHQSVLQGQRGVWNREGNQYMHFAAVMPNGRLLGVTRLEVDESGQLVSSTYVESASYQNNNWSESKGVSTLLSDDKMEREVFSGRNWEAEISPALLDILVLSAGNLPMHRLYTYANYLERQGQDASEYRLAFWQKALQPLAIASLVMIAISFIFGPLRHVTMGFRIFTGVIVGIIFRTSQDLLGPSSLIYGFSPLIAVLLPIVLSGLVGLFLLRKSL